METLDASELCVDDVCVTRDQFKALVEGSILGASSPANANGDEEAASAPEGLPTKNQRPRPHRKPITTRA